MHKGLELIPRFRRVPKLWPNKKTNKYNQYANIYPISMNKQKTYLAS